MEIANVISVNPGVKTLGRLHEEASQARELSRRLLETAGQKANEGEALDMVLASGSDVKQTLSRKLLFLRVVSGAALVAIGSYMGSSAGFTMGSIVEIVFGCSLITGCLTRLSSLAVLLFFGYESVELMMSGAPQ